MPNLVQATINRIQQAHPGATVYGRDRKGVVMQLAANSFGVYSSLGSLHYGPALDQEIDTDWQPSLGAWQWEMTRADYQAYARDVLNAGDLVQYQVGAEWVTFQPLGLNWVNQDNSRQQLALPQAVTAQATGDVLYWPNGYGPGRHFRYQTEGTRLSKRLIIDSAANLPAPTVTGTLNLELEFILKNSVGVDLWLDGVRWARTNNVRVRTANRIEFRNITTGAVLWYLEYPVAEDANGERVIGEFEVRRSGATYYITVRIPKTWVDTAVYPITIDPTVDVDVAAGADDGDETSANGAMDIAGVAVEFNSTVRYGATRFLNITVPAGATIDTCLWDLYSYNTTVDSPANGVIRMQLGDAATLSTTAYDITGRTFTTASVTVPGTTVDIGINAYWSALAARPELKTVLQEVVDGTWASGNDLLVMMTGCDTFATRTYDAGASVAPNIYIEYTTGGTTHNLTADSLATGAPTLGTPAIAQVHALAASSLATGAPTLGQGTVGQIHGLSADALATGAPTLGQPTVGQTHTLTADSLATGAPTLDQATLAQVHGLTAVSLSTGAPTLDAPTLGQTHALSANALATGAPTLGSPTLDAAGAPTLSGVQVSDYLRWTWVVA